MLDENLPTYRFKPSGENPLHTILYFTHNGSDPYAEYLLKRPAPSSASNQYALGLLDSQNTGVIWSEVLVKPEWTQPTLSAAEVRAGNGPPPQTPVIPDTFAISLYNPDQSIPVKLHQGSWGKSDSWEFEIPERTFRQPSSSRIDQDSEAPPVSELVPKLVFRWKRDGRLSKDMTCYMTGKSVGGKKSKEPDITVAFFRAKNDSILTIYEPNMARADVEDRKGLELAFLMSAEVIRDLYLNPRQNPFNVSGPAAAIAGRRRTTSPKASSSAKGPTMSGALGNSRPASPPVITTSPTQVNAEARARQQAEIDAETERLRAMVAEEERLAREREAREREKREQAEQKRLKKALEREEKERREREAEVERETERLRREFGMEGQDYQSPTSPTPQLPPRSGLAAPQLPVRPVSVGPSPSQGQFFAPPPQQPQPGSSNTNNAGGKKRTGLGGLLSSAAPYAGPAAASVSGFFGRADEDKRKKVQKKRSVHF
ncbi:hypothetical protein B0T10DRAFT_482080 [Thelonectria olida]|uniref:Uncharacterized protein n=1 Tax=Thelonectria olida TaxID=1576542 RepID=A0A9P9ARU9_9HYPO|nr:hypothetical protein B0T10DRAFT_482080 [Thelonectria olida]